MISEARTSKFVLLGAFSAAILLIVGIAIFIFLKMKKAPKKIRSRTERVSFGATRIDYFPPKQLPNSRFSGFVGPNYFVSTLTSFQGSVIEV